MRKTATHSTNRTMGRVLIVIALALLFWHLVLYWALHPPMTWADVVRIQQKRLIGGIGLLVCGMMPWAGLIARRQSARAAYKIRRRGRQIR